jgi:hypothetical protein
VCCGAGGGVVAVVLLLLLLLLLVRMVVVLLLPVCITRLLFPRHCLRHCPQRLASASSCLF